ncbi:hypothetical protein JCM10908_004485 [Rhodotorula pacifica]|uniref:uncharacterized protein n=1 Tax=Rhodotorula pacifica TaxID=1495444 RepID=UPI003175259B
MTTPPIGYLVGEEGWHVFGFPQLGLLFYTKHALLGAAQPGFSLVPACAFEHWTQQMCDLYNWVLSFGISTYAILLENLTVELTHHGPYMSGISTYNPEIERVTEFGLRVPYAAGHAFSTVLRALEVPVGRVRASTSLSAVGRPWLLPGPGSRIPQGAHVPAPVIADHVTAGPRYVEARRYTKRKDTDVYTPSGTIWLSPDANLQMAHYKSDLQAGRIPSAPIFAGQAQSDKCLYHFQMSQLGNPITDMLQHAESLPRSVTWSCRLTWYGHISAHRAFADHQFSTSLHYTLDWPPYSVPAPPVAFQPTSRDPNSTQPERPQLFQPNLNLDASEGSHIRRLNENMRF